ncbi:MAG: S49 family peptidase [Alphaproteobacteria bacterium]|nr:S49 family peptidase [Alphaproteobacteria bacterium]
MKLGALRRLVPIERVRNPPPVVAVLRLSGIIGQLGPLRTGLTLAGLAEAIERAFSLRRLRAVALAVNSPGGSAVQSALICRRIRALAEEKEVPVFAFAEDVAGSGGYWLALAGDEIFADESSIIGSVGVIFKSFGLAEAIGRLGIERRVYTAGENKSLLDPFTPEDPDDVARIKAIQGDVHETFKAMVRARRQGKLKAEEEELFSGAFWSGRRALELGLIDGIGDLRTVMRERFGDEVRLRVVTPARPWLKRRLGPGLGPRHWDGASPAGVPSLGVAAGAELVAGIIAAIEERALWSRFGL